MSWKSMSLTGWGRSSRGQVDAVRPERLSDVSDALATPGEGGIIAFGGGRSYGDAALNDGGQTVLTGRLNRLISFDRETGLLVCEAGVTFADLMRVFLPRGFLFPVTPGTAHVTVGGAVANDVHGKNHDQVGSFGDHVEWLDLALPDGEVVRISPTERPDLFAATIGGVGLTGVILQACFKMQRVPAASVNMREERMPDLDAFLEAFARHRDSATFSVGWIDGLAPRAALGRGILETAEFSEQEGVPPPPRRAPQVPFDLPGLSLNALSVRLFNRLYLRRIPAQGRSRTVPLESFFYPLDAIGNWNRVYGRRGFYQFQCIIPDAEAPAGVRRLLETTAKARVLPTLAVIKTLGSDGRGHLSFPMRGYTLAFDFPRRRRVGTHLARLEQITLEHGGRVYLAKDATLTVDGLRRMYPRLDELRKVLADVDPNGRMQSDLARRLWVRGDAP